MKQMSESFPVGALLAAAGGFLDAYTYMIRDRVFANAQTGNIVLFGIEIYEGNYTNAVKYMIPIIAFAAGIFIAEFIKSSEKGILHWRQIILFYEIILITAIGFMPCEKGINTVVNIIISFVCSLQVEAFRKLDGNAYATTMCTGNLRSASEALYKYIRLKDKSYLKRSIEYYSIILIFITGADFGVFMTNIFSYKSIWICSALLGIVFIMLFIRKDE